MEDGVTEIKELISSENNNNNNNNNNSLTEHEEGGEEEREGGGFINNLISNLVSPLSPKSKAEDTITTTFAENEKLDEEEKSSTGGGIFSNLISGILHQSEGDKEKDDRNQKERTKEEQVGGDGAARGLIDNIVSHLPSPLLDDAAPATDEASLLIHSIVHD